MGRELDPREVQDVARRATAAVARSAFDADAAGALDPDRLLDRLLPDRLDWRGAVRRFPLAAILTAGAAGFVAGRRRGDAIAAGVASGVRGAARDLFSGARTPGGSQPDGTDAGPVPDSASSVGWWP